MWDCASASSQIWALEPLSSAVLLPQQEARVGALFALLLDMLGRKGVGEAGTQAASSNSTGHFSGFLGKESLDLGTWAEGQRSPANLKG